MKAAFPSAVPLCMYVTQLLPACYWREHIPRHGGHPSERRVALVRRCHLPVARTDLAWKEQRSDSPATKIRPFRCLEKRLAAPIPTPHHPPRTSARDAQSQKEQSARVQARSYRLSARICRAGLSVCTVIGKEKWWNGAGVGRGRTHGLNDGT